MGQGGPPDHERGGIGRRPFAQGKAVCERHPGKAKVYFHMQTTHHGLMVMEAGPSLTVKPSKGFLKEIYPLLGEEGIEIEL